MCRVGLVGAETHIGEITKWAGTRLQIVGVVVAEHQKEAARFEAPLFDTEEAMLAQAAPDIVAVANPNDLKAASVLKALRAGCDVIVDKPLAITLEEQEAIEAFLAQHPERRLLNLLTLRGNPQWMAMRNLVQEGELGTPASVSVRMAVQLRRGSRPPWFLDVRRSGGLFLDLLIHGLDQVEWVTGDCIRAMTAVMGNLSDPADAYLRDHAAVFCELDGGSSALVEGQRMLPDTKGSDYRMLVAGTRGFADLSMAAGTLAATTTAGADLPVGPLPEARSVVADWLDGGELVSQAASLRANRLAILATLSANEHCRIEL